MEINSFTAKALAAAEIAAEEEFNKRMTEASISDPELYGFTLLSPEELTKEVGFTKGTGAIKIQYPSQSGKLTSFARYRFLGTFTGNKYHQLKNTPTHCYLPILLNTTFKKSLQDITIPLLITEGEFKSVRAVQAGYITLGLGGVDSITVNYNGSRKLIEPLNSLPVGKQVYIVYDYDGTNNGAIDNEPKKEVARAELRLAIMLSLRGCNVFFARLGNNGPTKIGLDDFLNNDGDLDNKLLNAKFFNPNKSYGESYLLSNYAVIEGDIVDIKNHIIMSASKFLIHEKNCKNPLNIDGDEKILPTQRFLSSLDRATLSEIIFDPTNSSYITAQNQLNIWRGFKTVPIEDDVSLWLEFTKLFFSDEPEIQHEFDACMALMLQKPWVKQDRLPILKSSATGIGKSFYFETFAALINGSMKGRPNGKFDHALVSSARDLDGDFNSSLFGKKFVVFNEIGEKGEKHTNLLKDMVTGHSLTINEKYSRAKSSVNYMQICITTNERYTHILDIDSRRELVYSVPRESELTQKLKDYWVSAYEMKEWVNTPTARSALLYYYLNYDLKGYDGTQPAPTNQSKVEMVEATNNDINYYIYEELDGINFIIPKLEIRRYKDMFQNNHNYSYIVHQFLENGFTKGFWCRTRSQLSLGYEGDCTALIGRPTVLCRPEYREFHLTEGGKEKILEALIERYYKNKKL